MAEEVFIPKLGQTVEEVTLIQWLVEDGARVTQGQTILEVQTDKTVFPIEAAENGVLHRGPYNAGDVVPVLRVVAIIGAPEDRFTSVDEPSGATVRVEAGTGERGTEEREAAAPVRAQGEKVFASPRARKLASGKNVDLGRVTATGYGGQRVAERDVVAYLEQMPRVSPVALRIAAEAGLDIRVLSGSGPGGRVMKEDVQRGMAAPQAPAKDDVLRRVPLKGVRGVIAERMAASSRTAAAVTLGVEADATALVELKNLAKAFAESWGFAPGYNDFLLKIVAFGLREFSFMNARVLGDAIEYLRPVNVGLAVDTDQGLLAPVVRDVDRKALREIGSELRAMIERARLGRSLPDDLSGGTFTVTNLGMYEVDFFTPVINLPEAAILGAGRIAKRQVWRGEGPVWRETLTLSLTFDHRVTDGAPAARFLQFIKRLIEEPSLSLFY